MPYTAIANAEDVTAGPPRAFEVEGTKIAVVRVDGALRAVEDTCPHQGGPLSEGEVKDGCVVCPWHRWAFDLESGACRTKEGTTVRTFPVKEEGGKVLVDVGEGGAASGGGAGGSSAGAAGSAGRGGGGSSGGDDAPEPREVKPGAGFGFLAKNRNEAVKNLLGFLGSSGRNLDPKTKYLIYCAMQTVTFSPRGLRQYIPKAIKAGASEDEVIDAILQAYPGAGLGKVVDALDVFLSLGYGGELPSKE